MRVFDTERQEWSPSRRERLFQTDRYLDLTRQRAVLQRTAVVLTVCGISFGGWALGWKDEPQPYRPPAQEAPADPGASGGSTTADPAQSASASATPPAGYTVLDDPQGFRVAVPEGWTRESQPSQYGIDIVEYRGPDGIRRIQIFQVMEATAHESVVDSQKTSSKLDGYQEIHVQDVTDPSGSEAAEHEYTADELSGEPATGATYHVIDYRFPAEDGEKYALIVYGSKSDSTDDERELLDTARAWFCPPSTQCAAPETS